MRKNLLIIILLLLCNCTTREIIKKGPATIQCYRIQVCNTLDMDEARLIRIDAIVKFIDEEVYLVFESPYYKIRIGRCLTLKEAKKLQQIAAVNKGFDDAWIVKIKIRNIK